MSAAESRINGNLRGIFWMAMTGILFVMVTGIVRHLGTDMNAVQAAFIRYFFGLLLLAPVFFKVGNFVRERRIMGLHAVRGFIHGLGVMLWFFAMAKIPIAEVTALGFTAPIFTTLGAALFLGERLYLYRIGAVLIGFGGAIIVLQPGFQAISIGSIAQLVASPLFACSMLIAKRLTRTESSTAIVAYLSIFVTLTLLPPALLVWRTPTLVELAWLFATAVCATAGHVTLTQAFRSADITVTQPIQFLQLVWATILGLTLFGEQPEIWTWIGGGVIVASATYIARRESRAQRPKAS
ncbi:MAG: DMT family transporter [Rhodospirillaceae bacterium]|jgi:drug/metabolite transporter (DMT)-like permease|nr:DMT family transporter [Rhodospirillaceae bacterium]MBT3930881.1 DMT family transporter [Rhodospirillaceae bacterium]MBT4773135.1 DMT family transporter [Rhodospirillaceae bacterium]MBT5358403.1 DMT family transporter [Rhodospirillaceae bacterium]MBT5768441.1 DMT family transporter [Rhodospirillaceae bacterium]